MSVLDLLRKGVAHERAKHAAQLSSNVSRHDATDRHMLADVKRDSPMWAAHFDEPINVPDGIQYEGAGDLYDDLWMSLHHIGDAGVKDADEVKPSRMLGRSALEALQRTEDFHRIKARSSGNSTMTSIGFGAMADKLRETFDNPDLSDQAERAEQLADAEQGAQMAQDDIDALRDQAQAARQMGQPTDEIAKDMRDAIKGREAARATIEQLMQQPQGGTPRVIADAAEQAAEAGVEATSLWGQIQSLDPANLKHARPDEALALMEAFSQLPNFREFLELLGRDIRRWRALDARKVRPGTDEVVGIDIGNDLTRILPTELMQLGHPTLRRKFLRDYIDEDLLQFDQIGIDKAAKGPSAFLLDMSGSQKKNNRFLRALACAIGFAKLMNSKRRDAIVFPFNGSVKAPVVFKAGKPLDMEAVLMLAGLRPTGGTDIHAAVIAAERVIDKLPEFNKADITILTDGQYDFLASRDVPAKERLLEKGIRTHGVAIDHTPTPHGYLMQFCDDTIRADDLVTAAEHLVNVVT